MTSKLIHVADVDDLKDGEMKALEVDDEQICIINIKGNYYVISNVCTHEGGPLNEGMLEGYEVECPWHGARFDVRTGKVISPPAEESVKVYKVRVDGNKVFIEK